MAKDRGGREGVYVDKPRNDVYVVMLIFTTLATLAAIGLMYMAKGQ